MEVKEHLRSNKIVGIYQSLLTELCYNFLVVHNKETHEPFLEPGYIIPCVGSRVEEKFYVFIEVSHMMLIGTIVHRLTKLMPTSVKYLNSLQVNKINK
jgi:hypothetical protein